MSLPPDLDTVDHVHVHVADRAAAERWYREVLGLERVPSLAFWAADGGPLTLANRQGNIHLALFERAPLPHHATVAFAVGADAFLHWREHLADALGARPKVVDHQQSWSMYLADPDGNPYEITSYAYDAVARGLDGRA